MKTSKSKNQKVREAQGQQPLPSIRLHLDEIKPNPENPRVIKDAKFLKLKKSLQESPWMLKLRPIVVDKDNMVLGGNMRLKALKELNVQYVDVVRAEDLTDEQKKEFIIKDNVSFGEWDMDVLKGWDIDSLIDWGMDMNKEESKVKEDEFDVSKHADENYKPKTVPGDVYEFHSIDKKIIHRLFCGNSEFKEDFTKLMANRSAQMCFTDIPYNVDYKSPNIKNGKIQNSKQKEGKIQNDNINPDRWKEFCINCLKNIYEFTDKNACMYWWFANNKHSVVNRESWAETGWYFSQQIIWLKNSMVFSIGQDYHRMHEPCLFGWKAGQSHFTNKRYRKFKDAFSLELDDFRNLIDVWYENRDETHKYIHPTQKPIRLAERALKKNSNVGSLILDCFGGSGSTMMACEQMDRPCYLMELDPKFCDAIVFRYHKFMTQEGKKFVINLNGKKINGESYHVE